MIPKLGHRFNQLRTHTVLQLEVEFPFEVQSVLMFVQHDHGALGGVSVLAFQTMV